MEYTADNLLIPGKDGNNISVFARVSAEQAGWQYLNVVALRLNRGGTFDIAIDDYEYISVILAGRCNIRTSRGDYMDVGRRRHVFDGMPYAVYLPRKTEFTIEALTDDFEMASCWSPTTQDHPIRLITPDDTTFELQGGGAASVQVNPLVMPDFGSHRLMAYETYTPSGNWTNYPPHKHDAHQTGPNDTLLQAKLEEVCLFKFNRPGGFAWQRIYNDSGSIDATFTILNNDMVIVPEGYHPYVSAHGFHTYGLHVLAGSALSLDHTIDPDYLWIPKTWTGIDDRLPLVDPGMEPLKLD